MERIWDTVIRTLVGFAVLLLLTRLAGKKQIGQMTVFTYITGIALGNMAGDMIIHKDVEIMDGVIGMTLWSVLIFLMEYLSLNLPGVRVLLDGEPVLVIKKGVVQAKELKKMRLNMDDLTMLLREKDVFSIREVQYAILEPHGELSVVKKAVKQQASKEDLNLQPQEPAYLPGEIITDGKVIARNLREFGKSEEWLRQQLAAQGISSAKDVLYAELEEDGTLFVQTRR